MLNSNIACAIVLVVSAFVQCVHNLDYSDLQVMGVICMNLKERYNCDGETSRLDHHKRGCECDTACSTFNDCCINAPTRRTNVRSSTRDRITCLQAGENEHGGVYGIDTCLTDWIGPAEVRQKCEGPVDMSDPLNAAPVTSVVQAVTYRNRYCAECNRADLENLRTFRLKLGCPKTEFMSDEQVYTDLRYDNELGVWGLDRWNATRNSTNFVTCDINFDVPSYFFNSVRFCKTRLISSCPPEYSRYLVKKSCEDYMAVVYDGVQGYRNPHCGICNGKTVDELTCGATVSSRKKPISFPILLDINMNDGEIVGMTRMATPQCPSNHKYDPYFKKCRRLVCAIPRHVLVNGKCVRQA